MSRRILPLLLLLPGPAAAQILRTPTEDSITLNRDPVALTDAARKGYVDAQIAAARALLSTGVAAAMLGQPGGPAQLGPSGTLPAAQLPFGTAAGTVAAGDALAAETSRALAAEAATVTATAQRATAAALATEAQTARAAEAAVQATAAAAVPATALGLPNGPARLGAGGLLPLAQLPVGTGAGSVAAGNDPRIAGAAPAASLAPVAISGAYGDLHGLPVIPVVPPVGTGAGTLAAGNDPRIAGAAQAGSLAAVATSGAYSDLAGRSSPWYPRSARRRALWPRAMTYASPGQCNPPAWRQWPPAGPMATCMACLPSPWSPDRHGGRHPRRGQ